jgi:hypothetical protein
MVLIAPKTLLLCDGFVNQQRELLIWGYGRRGEHRVWSWSKSVTASSQIAPTIHRVMPFFGKTFLELQQP